MFRACELKDQTYKKTRTLHFSAFPLFQPLRFQSLLFGDSLDSAVITKKQADHKAPTSLKEGKSVAISAASDRGAKCPTAEKQPKGVPRRVGHGKTAGKTAGKQPEKHPKNSQNNCFSGVSLFFGCFTVTHSAPFSAVFRLFSMSGIWHLCSWPQRLQEKCHKSKQFFGNFAKVDPGYLFMLGQSSYPAEVQK